jgi:hypothetical protein
VGSLTVRAEALQYGASSASEFTSVALTVVVGPLPWVCLICANEYRTFRISALCRFERNSLPDAKHRLLDSIIALSAEGSRLALDNLPPLPPTEQDHFRQRVRLLIQRWLNHGLEVDMTDVFYLDDQNDVAEYLDTHGWDTLTASTSDLFAAHRLAPRAENNDAEDLRRRRLHERNADGRVPTRPRRRSHRPGRPVGCCPKVLVYREFRSFNCGLGRTPNVRCSSAMITRSAPQRVSLSR